MLKSVLMSVDLPSPDSPETKVCQVSMHAWDVTTLLTDDHGSKLESLPDTLPVDLVRQVRKTNIAVELFANYGRGARVGGLGERRAGTVHPARSVGSERVAIGRRNV